MEKEIKPGQHLTDEQAMELAIHVAKSGAPYVAPNPLVGCVILSAENKFLSAGYHARFGEAHAEVNALKNISEKDLMNSKVFVTLEPCAHEGKTGSCAKRLSQYKIKQVVYGLIDPNPLVAGQGAQILRDAGIAVEEYQGQLKDDLEDLAEVFLKNFREEKTFVALKMASSLDGQIALKNGESQWITGPASREYVHELRSWYDAIIVGHRTVEMDNPSLNIRHSEIQKENKVIILDPNEDILKSARSGKSFKFLECHQPQNIYFATGGTEETYGSISVSDFNVLKFKNLKHLMEQLWALKIKSVFVEGGAATHSSFLQQKLVDRVHAFINPSIIGAGGGLSWTKGLSIDSLNQKIQLQNVKTRLFTPDIYITGKVHNLSDPDHGRVLKD